MKKKNKKQLTAAAPVVEKLRLKGLLEKEPTADQRKKLGAALLAIKELLMDAPIYEIGNKVYTHRQMLKLLRDTDE